MGEFADYYLEDSYLREARKPRVNIRVKVKGKKDLEIARLKALVLEAKVITAALVVGGYTPVFTKEINAAITRFNRKKI